MAIRNTYSSSTLLDLWMLKNPLCLYSNHYSHYYYQCSRFIRAPSPKVLNNTSLIPRLSITEYSTSRGRHYHSGTHLFSSLPFQSFLRHSLHSISRARKEDHVRTPHPRFHEWKLSQRMSKYKPRTSSRTHPRTKKAIGYFIVYLLVLERSNSCVDCVEMTVTT